MGDVDVEDALDDVVVGSVGAVSGRLISHVVHELADSDTAGGVADEDDEAAVGWDAEVPLHLERGVDGLENGAEIVLGTTVIADGNLLDAVHGVGIVPRVWVYGVSRHVLEHTVETVVSDLEVGLVWGNRICIRRLQLR